MYPQTNRLSPSLDFLHVYVLWYTLRVNAFKSPFVCLHDYIIMLGRSFACIRDEQTVKQMLWVEIRWSSPTHIGGYVT